MKPVKNVINKKVTSQRRTTTLRILNEWMRKVSEKNPKENIHLHELVEEYLADQKLTIKKSSLRHIMFVAHLCRYWGEQQWELMSNAIRIDMPTNSIIKGSSNLSVVVPVKYLSQQIKTMQISQYELALQKR